MKIKTVALIISMLCIAFLSGCNGKANSEMSSLGGSIDSVTTGFADFAGEYPQNPISVLTSSDDEICRIINDEPNLKCADNIYINIPESAAVFDFHTYGVHVPQFDYPSSLYKSDFEKMFKYLFPEKEMDLNCLKYSKYLGYDSENGDYITDEGLVRDHANLPDGVEFIYDGNVYLEAKAEIGVGSGVIIKGEAARIALEDAPDSLSGFDPHDYFESAGIYSPQSEKSFPLLDGEMRICDAVEFFEDYVNNIPISTGLQKNARTSVYNVEVLKVDGEAECYGYYFKTTPQFQGVNYEPVIYGSMSEYSYNPIGGEGFMIRRDDVDYIHCVYGSLWTFDVEQCDEIVSIDTAIKTISGKLTDEVIFDVLSIEFVYAQQFVKDELEHIIIDTYEAKITPAWRITAGNSNDNRTYICYVDAADGGNFRYYSAPEIIKYCD